MMFTVALVLILLECILLFILRCCFVYFIAKQ